MERYKTHLTAKSRIEKLKQQFIVRGASEAEIKQLEEIEDIITQDKVKF